MADLFQRSVKRAEITVSLEQRRKQANVAYVHKMATSGLFNGSASGVHGSGGVENVLTGPGLAQPVYIPEVATKSDDSRQLHSKVVVLRQIGTLTQKAAEVLSIIVEGYERSKGEEQTFENYRLGEVLGLTAVQAGEIIDDLQRVGLVAPRISSMGGRAGFVPTLPKG